MVIRFGTPGETMTALNGKQYKLDERMTVIGDGDGQAHSLGGIIGGVDSGCNNQTVDVFLECALFDPIRTAETGRRLDVITDARQPFRARR